MPRHPPVEFGDAGPADWGDRPLFIVCGGPSLRGYDLSGLRSRGRVLGVNRAPEIVPCDALYSQDRNYIRHLGRRRPLPGLPKFLAVDRTYDGESDPEATYLALVPLLPDAPPLSTDPTTIPNGLNSGHGATNLAILKGAREIVLLGLDLTDPGAGPTHWHDGYRWGGTRRLVKYWDRWRDVFDRTTSHLPPGVSVYNGNPRSGVRSFPFWTYEELGLPHVQSPMAEPAE